MAIGAVDIGRYVEQRLQLLGLAADVCCEHKPPFELRLHKA